MNTDNEGLSMENLIQLLQDPDPVVRIHAGFILGTMEEEAVPALPILIYLLKYGDVQDKKLAATTLGQIGPAAADALPALFEAANDDEDVADMAVWALEEIDLADEDQDTDTEPDAEAA